MHGTSLLSTPGQFGPVLLLYVCKNDDKEHCFDLKIIWLYYNFWSSTQILFPGWAIITASWADVYSRYFENDQTLYKLYKKAIEEGNIETLSYYGFLYSYGMYQIYQN